MRPHEIDDAKEELELNECRGITYYTSTQNHSNYNQKKKVHVDHSDEPLYVKYGIIA